MKAYWGSGGIAPRTELGIKWKLVLSFRPGRFTPRERAPGTQWIEVWVYPRTGLVVKRKIPSPFRDRTPTIQPVAQRYNNQLSRLLSSA
jgi:hypothetical protein